MMTWLERTMTLLGVLALAFVRPPNPRVVVAGSLYPGLLYVSCVAHFVVRLLIGAYSCLCTGLRVGEDLMDRFYLNVKIKRSLHFRPSWCLCGVFCCLSRDGAC